MHIDEIAEKVQRPREARDREGFRAGRGAGVARRPPPETAGLARHLGRRAFGVA